MCKYALWRNASNNTPTTYSLKNIISFCFNVCLISRKIIFRNIEMLLNSFFRCPPTTTKKKNNSNNNNIFKNISVDNYRYVVLTFKNELTDLIRDYVFM